VTFLWAPLLLAVLLVPLGMLLARRIERGRRGRVAALVGASPAGSAAAKARARRPLDRVAPALVVVGMVVLMIALARPQATVALPRLEGTLMLTFDVSASMGATDVTPSRMDEAKAAAKAIVDRQPPGVVIGVVAFSDAGLAVVPPTGDAAKVTAAIDRMAPTRGTSLGGGILASLDAIAKAAAGTPSDYYSNRSPAPSASPQAVAPGSDASTIIVLFSDGENTTRPDPTTASQTAADRGIRIVTVGVGTAAGATLDLEGFKVQSSLDEVALQQIADTTKGAYYPGSDPGAAATAVYDELAQQLVVRTEPLEITALVAALGLLLIVAGAALSLARTGRLP
jgi:Ca-activated chloride channel family protein